MLNSRLPSEITDEIIDHLHDDRRTLCSCSLTCFSWRARSQLHIFASVTLAKSELYTLTNAPHLAAHILHITLPLSLEGCDSFLAICPLPRVEAVTLVRTPSPRADHLTRIGTAFPNARTLTLDKFATFPHFLALLEILRVFPRIVHVHLNQNRIQGRTVSEPAPPLPLAPSPSLGSLSLDTCYGSDIFESWIHPHVYPLVEDLRQLHFHSVGDIPSPYWHDSARAIGALAGRVSRTLEELDINVSAPFYAKDILAEYCRTRVPSPALRHLRASIREPHGKVDMIIAEFVADMRAMVFDSRTYVELIVPPGRLDIDKWPAVKAELSRAPLPWRFMLDIPGFVYDSERNVDALAEG